MTTERSGPTALPAWHALTAHFEQVRDLHLRSLFADDPSRGQRLVAEGAGLYLEVHPQWVWMGGGFWAPETPQLVRIREHIAETHPELHKLARSKAFTRAGGELYGDKLTRVPRGYAKDHPAAEYLKFRQFLAGREFPAEFACQPGFYRGVLDVYRQIAPLVRFLNEPLTGR